AYPDMPGRFAPPEAAVTVLASPAEDAGDALARLAEALAAPTLSPPEQLPPPPASGTVTNAALGRSLAALLPESAIVIDEGITNGFGLYPPMAAAAPHDLLRHVGGAIGQGL